jgi:hypothetical protein
MKRGKRRTKRRHISNSTKVTIKKLRSAAEARDFSLFQKGPNQLETLALLPLTPRLKTTGSILVRPTYAFMPSTVTVLPFNISAEGGGGNKNGSFVWQIGKILRSGAPKSYRALTE